jgi:hypothetical protein
MRIAVLIKTLIIRKSVPADEKANEKNDKINFLHEYKNIRIKKYCQIFE